MYKSWWEKRQIGRTLAGLSLGFFNVVRAAFALAAEVAEERDERATILEVSDWLQGQSLQAFARKRDSIRKI